MLRHHLPDAASFAHRIVFGGSRWVMGCFSTELAHVGEVVEVHQRGGYLLVPLWIGSEGALGGVRVAGSISVNRTRGFMRLWEMKLQLGNGK